MSQYKAYFSCWSFLFHLMEMLLFLKSFVTDSVEQGCLLGYQLKSFG